MVQLHVSFGLSILLGVSSAFAQSDLASFQPSDPLAFSHPDEDGPSPHERYDRMNTLVGGDSIRLCNGRPCTGWIEDRYEDGTLLHRGLYEEGCLVVYKNHHTNGSLEREFKQRDAMNCILRTYYDNTLLRSETRYWNGSVEHYQDYYSNGVLRYAEERHKKEPYYVRMDLYGPSGEPLSLLRLVDRKRVEFELKEYHPGGTLSSEGLARYDQRRMDSKRIGTWRYYGPDGVLVREEDYVDGKVHTVR